MTPTTRNAILVRAFGERRKDASPVDSCGLVKIHQETLQQTTFPSLTENQNVSLNVNDAFCSCLLPFCFLIRVYVRGRG